MIQIKEGKLIRRNDKELLSIEVWGQNSFRVRATQRHAFENEDIQALLPSERPEMTVISPQEITESTEAVMIKNGKISCKLSRTGKLTFYNQKGEVLLEEYERIRGIDEEGRKEFNSALEIIPRTFQPIQNADNYALTVRFESDPREKIFGMGQYQQENLDVKGCILELAHRNSQASVPFMLSNKGYGFLWNNPSIGKVTFGKNLTEWTSQSTKQMDYWITAGDTPSEIEQAYAAVTGTVPMMPDYGLGFWQCKLRYQTQDELLKVAREYKRRNLPLDLIVIDFFHWPNQGDWKFDQKYWPDPEKMVQELKEMGIELMVSIWPTVDEGSENYREMVDLGYLTRSEYGKRIGQLGDACFIDVTNPDARTYVWDTMKKNYYDMGIKAFWLDEAEPEFTGYEFENYRYFRGSDMEVGNIFPREYARMAYEGMEKDGQENIVNLLRCAWAGSQRYGALVWSGDIDSSFRSLRNQLAAGLNMGISGLPWWTTDIGGFHGGNIYDDSFKELFVRWFEFAAFCPVMRLHGFREPFKKALGMTGGGKQISGADNEVWSYGEEVLNICTRYLALREKLKPYTKQLMEEAHKLGTPIMRPLFYDFPNDPGVWEIEDQYMYGPDYMVAPVLYEKQVERKVYLPAGKWKDLHGETIYDGGKEIHIDAPLDKLPVFFRSE